MIEKLPLDEVFEAYENMIKCLIILGRARPSNSVNSFKELNKMGVHHRVHYGVMTRTQLLILVKKRVWE